MKTRSFASASLLTAALLALAPGLLRAQTPPAADPTSPAPQRPFFGGQRFRNQQGQGPGQGQMRPWMRRFQNQNPGQGGLGQNGGPRKQFLQSLTPEERRKFRAARQTLMADPQVRAAFERRAQDGQAFRQTMRSAMLKADPSLAPVIERFEKQRREAQGQQLQRFAQRTGFLAPEERETLLRSRQAVQNDPAVVSARQARDAATPETLQQATRVYNQAVQAAMIRSDPRVGNILEKVRQQHAFPPPASAQPGVPQAQPGVPPAQTPVPGR